MNLDEKWSTMSRTTKSFCFLALSNYILLAVLAVEPLIETTLTTTQKTNQTSKIQSYIIIRTLIFLMIILFQIVHIFFGLFHDNIYELGATMVTQLLVCVIIILRSCFSVWDIYTILLVTYAVAFQLIYVAFAHPLYTEHQWNFYKKAGADSVIRANYRNFLRLFVLLRLDLMVRFINILVFDETLVWLLLYDTVCGVATALTFNFGRFGFSQEKKTLVIIFWSLSWICPMAALVGISSLIVEHRLSIFDIKRIAGTNDQLVFPFLFVASGILFIVLRVLLIAQSMVVYFHFGEGIPNLDKEGYRRVIPQERWQVKIQVPTGGEGRALVGQVVVPEPEGPPVQVVSGSFTVSDVIYNTLQQKQSFKEDVEEDTDQ